MCNIITETQGFTRRCFAIKQAALECGSDWMDRTHVTRHSVQYLLQIWEDGLAEGPPQAVRPAGIGSCCPLYEAFEHLRHAIDLRAEQKP